MSKRSSLRHALKKQKTTKPLKLISSISPATVIQAVAAAPVASAPQTAVLGATCTPQDLKSSEDLTRFINENVLPGIQGPAPSPALSLAPRPVPMAKSISVFSAQTPTLALPPLEPRHRTFLVEQCGLGDVMIAQRGYSSIAVTPQGRRILRSLGFTATQVGEGGGLLIPQRNIIGMVTSYVYRPDRQRLDAEGRAVEFERLSANGGVLDLDIPATLHDPSWGRGPRAGLTIWTTNPICADSATALALNVVNINGLALSWNDLLSARVRGSFGLEELDEAALFVFNSNWGESDAVYASLNNLMKFFALRGQNVRMVFLAPGPQGQKRTLASFIARGGTLDELLAQSIFSPGSTS